MISTAILDLETSDLCGDRGIILCGVIKSSLDRKVHIYRSDEMNKAWDKGKRGDDSAAVKAIAADICRHDVVVAHNGRRFDLPFLRTRMARWALPALPRLKLVDPLKLAWDHLKMGRNSLGSIADLAGVKDKKTPIEWHLWMEATLNGCRKAMDEIVKHCVADVKVLEGVLQMVKPYCRQLDEFGSSR